MIIKKYAAIDIGSNAIRLLIQNILLEENKPAIFKKSNLTRVPIRLGEDAFSKGYISDENIQRMILCMEAFQKLMQIERTEKYKVCATSAMRCATNAVEIKTRIKEKTGIDIEIIDGDTEAKIITATDFSKTLESDKSYLFVDVGGGSTEFSLFENGKNIAAKSFKMGTVRMIKEDPTANKEFWKSAEKWVKKKCKSIDKISVIGSGGNINHLFKMSGRKTNRYLSIDYLQAQYDMLKKMSYTKRIVNLGLNADRADVIVPATKIYLRAMKWIHSDEIYVPNIGLADGIIKSLYYGIIS